MKLTKCQLERRRIQRRVGIASYTPECDEKGNFNQIQCKLKKPKVTICWRVNKHGRKVPNSEISVKMGITNTQIYPPGGKRGHYTKNKMGKPLFCPFMLRFPHLIKLKVFRFLTVSSASSVSVKNTKCIKRRQRRLKLKKTNPNVFVPKCKRSGKFKRTQCNPSMGKCWCVNPTTGRKLKETEERNGRKPNCRQGR